MNPEYIIIAAIIVASQPLTGTDIARALWPASGRVKAVGAEVTWSATELAPLVPMGADA